MADNNWIEGTLSDACETIDYGYTASASTQSIGPRFLRITDIVSGHIAWETVPHVEADRQTLEKYRLSDGDIVLARTGASTGASAYILNPPEALFASYLVRLKITPSFDGRFVAYYLKSDLFWSYIHGVLGDKSAQPNASALTMTRAPLRAPRDINEQRAIAHILGTLDDKIELNRRMNETLEAMARAIFTSWFVDFEPVRAKDEGRDPGLPKPFADLFPDSLEDSELGDIPKGWAVGTLGDVANHVRRSVQPSEIDPSMPYIALEHMPKKCIALADWGTAKDLQSNKFVFKKGEILFGKLRPYFHKVGVAPLGGVCSTDIVVVAPRAEIWYGSVLGHISSVDFVEYTNAGSTGTKMPRTSWQVMARYPISVPPETTADQLNQIIQPFLNRIIANIHESRTLSRLRAILLPKLMSGGLMVKDPKRFIKEAKL